MLVQTQSTATQGTRLFNYSNRHSGGLSHNHVKPIHYVGNVQQYLLQQVVYTRSDSKVMRLIFFFLAVLAILQPANTDSR